MSNYYQNKNNSWDYLCGELLLLQKANKNIYIMPINIIFNKVPYLYKNSIIKKFEIILYKNHIKLLKI